MRSAVTMTGLALFVAACGGSNDTTGASAGSSTGATTSDGGATTGGGTTGATTTGGGTSAGAGTTGGGYVDAGLVDGTACSADLACASHVCGVAGSGNCCSIKCASTNAACAASGCDSNGTCIYPSGGATGGAPPACGGTCAKSNLDAYFCDTSGNCSVSTGQAFPCPGDYACDTAGTACKTTCTADTDCAPLSFCLGGNCGLRLKAGPCTVNDGCTTQVCGLGGTGNCCNAACAPTADPACDPTGCDVATAACTYPTGNACGAPTCVNSMFTLQGKGSCSAAGVCDTTPAPCANNFGCNAGGTTCNTTCMQRSDCATGFYCNAGACIPEIAVGACFENAECVSNVCGAATNGNCCAAQCAPTQDPACDPINCDPTAGGCLYPAGFACGGATCSNAVLSMACNTSGACVANTTPCANNYACNSAGSNCNSTCAADSDCVGGYWCNTTTGVCIAQIAVGACTGNDQCTSGVCGVSGTGHCCGAACTNTNSACAAMDCGATTAECVFPSNTACGTTLESCANGTQQDPSVCDGNGNCPPPGTMVCSPYLCNSTGSACDTKCTDATSCITGDFCDTGKSACCSPLTGGTVTVDGKSGKDDGCCGINGNTACLTLTRAMSLIDAAQAKGVTINASIGGAGGDWAPKGETYPIVLGWGVELSAPGVYFYDPNADAEIFDINFYSTNDTVGYASIVGSGTSLVYIGWDQNEEQSTDSSAIMVEASNTLYIANALVNGSTNVYPGTNAITVAAGGSLTLGQDQSAGNTGTVNIGTTYQYGWNGIVCQTDNVSLGCTITDANLGGTSSVIIEFQENMDIDAEDFASISLTSNPIVGTAPSPVGYLNCNNNYGKPDVSSANYQAGQAIWLNGAVNMTFNNGTVQCISGNAFTLNTSPNGNGNPTLTMSGTTIQNVEYGILATAGTANVFNSTINYLFTGVEQSTDGTNIAAIDLSADGGSTGTTNTVACVNSAESVWFYSGGWGISASAVVDETTSNLNASYVNWDTSGPDDFSCTNSSLTTCTCEISSCTNAAGADGMDAVYDSTGTVNTANNGAATQDCTPPIVCPGQYGSNICSNGEICCTEYNNGCCETAGNCDYCD